jgi:uncharacterized membrane protein HdeD (DUF308 family)
MRSTKAAQSPAVANEAGARHRLTTSRRKGPLTASAESKVRFQWLGEIMIILGIILLIIGFVAKIAIVWTIGIIVLVLGLIAVLLGSIGHAVGGRRHYW